MSDAKKERDYMENKKCNCGELRREHTGQKVCVNGWYENLRRVSKSLGFLLLRDFYGTVQVVVESEKMLEELREINRESTLSITGTVRERSSRNPQMATGDIEVVPERIEVLGRCRYEELPFEIRRSKESDENLRLKYRYLDLRNPQVRDNIILRSRVAAELRQRMEKLGFLEITTPILTASSPEGARDYLVPSRNFPGQFYALPQAPQQFKQLLMASGFDRYYQIAPCFRDEDARADRSPGEFYQLDMEMAFAGQEEVFEVIEEVLPPVFEKFGRYHRASPAPFIRIPYQEAMERFGTDKPDMRIKLEIEDVGPCMKGCGMSFLEKTYVKAVAAPRFNGSRKEIEGSCKEIEALTGHQVYWFKVTIDGGEKLAFTGGVSKHLLGIKEELAEKLKLTGGELVYLVAGDNLREVQKAAGELRKRLGSRNPQYMEEGCYAFCWIVDFPMYEVGEESGKLEFCHNPFSMPQGGLKELEEKDPLDVYAYQYDLVCNGIELSSGAVRNHEPDIMVKAFEIAGMNEEDVKKKFPAMYQAFCYGAPPHAGIAPGLDRMVMLLSGEENIREVIAFPMNKRAQDVMCGAPGKVSKEQLSDVHIKVCDASE